MKRVIRVGDLVCAVSWYFVLDTLEQNVISMENATHPNDVYVVIGVEGDMCRIVLPGGDLKGWIGNNRLKRVDKNA